MIFFDLDGTLLNSTGLWLQIDRIFLENRGILTLPDDYLRYVTNNNAPKSAAFTKERFQLPDSPEQILQEWQDMALHAYCHELPLTRGAKSLLHSLREENIPTSLLTACLPDLCHGALDKHKIKPYFKDIHIVTDLGFDKRDKELFPLVANIYGKHPSQCILIDDAIDYCFAAKQAGFTVIGIQDPHAKDNKDHLTQICDMYIEDLTQLTPSLLKKLSDDLEESYLATL